MTFWERGLPPAKRVLMTADTVGGVWTYALDLVRELREVEFALATMGRALSPDQWREVRALPNVAVYESTFRLEWMEEPWDDVARAGEWLLSLEADFRPDVVHLNGLVHGALPWRAPTIVVVHSCVLSWWSAVKGGSPPAEWDRYATEVRRSLQAARRIVTPTDAMRRETERLYGPLRRIETISNGRAPYQLCAKEPFVFAAGRMWDEAKNLRALSSLDCEWPILTAGEGSRLGRLTGEETRRMMARASIYALPARYEPFGLSVLEAALAGCALVLGDIPSLRENWEGCALFVDPDDASALENEVDRLISDPALRSHLGERAAKKGRDLSVERFGTRYREAYASLVGQESLVAR